MLEVESIGQRGCTVRKCPFRHASVEFPSGGAGAWHRPCRFTIWYLVGLPLMTQLLCIRRRFKFDHAKGYLHGRHGVALWKRLPASVCRCYVYLSAVLNFESVSATIGRPSCLALGSVLLTVLELIVWKSLLNVLKLKKVGIRVYVCSHSVICTF